MREHDRTNPPGTAATGHPWIGRNKPRCARTGGHDGRFARDGNEEDPDDDRADDQRYGADRPRRVSVDDVPGSGRSAERRRDYRGRYAPGLSLIHISEPTRRTPISYAV